MKPSCKDSLDICFVIDETRSITVQDLHRVLNAASLLAASVFGDGHNRPRFSVVTFHEEATIRVPFSGQLSLRSFYYLLERMKDDIRHKPTRIDKALEKVNEAFGGPGNRPNSPDVMIIFTDAKTKTGKWNKFDNAVKNLNVSASCFNAVNKKYPIICPGIIYIYKGLF